MKVLSRQNDVEVLGPLFGDSHIFAPYAQELEYIVAQVPSHANMSLGAYRHLWQYLVDRANGDVVYAFKPVLASYGAALLAKYWKRRPIVLDIEDWDAYPFHQLKWRSRMHQVVIRNVFHNQFSPFSLRFMETLINFADRRVVSSTFLQRRYGGLRLVQGTDCEMFSPDKYQKKELREELNLSLSQIIVLFSGMIHPHKGVDELVKAVEH